MDIWKCFPVTVFSLHCWNKKWWLCLRRKCWIVKDPKTWTAQRIARRANQTPSLTPKGPQENLAVFVLLLCSTVQSHQQECDLYGWLVSRKPLLRRRRKILHQKFEHHRLKTPNAFLKTLCELIHGENFSVPVSKRKKTCTDPRRAVHPQTGTEMFY